MAGSKFTCDKCGKTYSYENSYLTHLKKHEGETPKLTAPKGGPDPKEAIAASISRQYDALLSMVALMLFRFSPEDAKVIYMNKAEAVKAMGAFGAEHLWVKDALDKVVGFFGVGSLLMAHLPMIEGIIRNHTAKELTNLDHERESVPTS